MVHMAPVTEDHSAVSEEGVGSDAFAMILQLLRASSVTATRLQLALTRDDRRQAMAHLDYLLDIDGEIERMAGELSSARADDPDWQAILSYLSAQRQAIAAEKHVLAGEIEKPVARPQGAGVEMRAPAVMPAMATTGEPAGGLLRSRTGVLLVLLLAMVGIVAILATG